MCLGNLVANMLTGDMFSRFHTFLKLANVVFILLAVTYCVAKIWIWENISPCTVCQPNGSRMTPQNSVNNASFYKTHPLIIDHPAVVMRPIGRLGNQLFQYACHYSLARKHDWPLFVLNNTYFDSALHTLNIHLDQFNLVKHHPCERYSLDVYDEQLLDCDYPQTMCTSLGYCQSEVFFSSYKRELLDDVFSFKQSVRTPAVNYWKARIDSTESVAVHIRRGDYVTEYKEELSPEFYLSCMETIEAKLASRDVTYYIFTDDIFQVPTEISRMSNAALVSSPHTQPIHELYLMSKCKHHINPPSSFSWWGAYLSRPEETGGIVCAAKHREDLYTHIVPKGNLSFNVWMDKYLYYPTNWIGRKAKYLAS